ncbi:hypothetical protein FEM03_14220 [Phragmitibacter flavus]|uniref:Uncharacterized protein n=1 Tax=Phragmitibacter flavus TaxID=2576071 RepID=A0A5R8KE62_9BACT|nr:hypothetical protein [Phragmitibacter flavus]TLD69889.1 hypothetical protein FEM03_14220 [Phragmitibacter flavus]
MAVIQAFGGLLELPCPLSGARFFGSIVVMGIDEVNACAIVTINRFYDKNGRRPGSLFMGPQEIEVFRTHNSGVELNFFGIPVEPMELPGVMAKDE